MVDQKPRCTLGHDIPIGRGLGPLPPLTDAEIELMENAVGREIHEEPLTIIYASIGAFIGRIITNDARRKKEQKKTHRRFFQAAEKDPVFLSTIPADHPLYSIWLGTADYLDRAAARGESEAPGKAQRVGAQLRDIAKQMLLGTRRGAPPDETFNEFIEMNLSGARFLGLETLPQLSRDAESTTPLFELIKVVVRIACNRGLEMISRIDLASDEFNNLKYKLNSYMNKSDLALLKLLLRLRGSRKTKNTHNSDHRPPN